MGKFNIQLFDYVTSKEEVFRTAIEISEEFHLIKEKLINDFWEEVISCLKLLLVESNY